MFEYMYRSDCIKSDFKNCKVVVINSKDNSTVKDERAIFQLYVETLRAS